MKNWIGRWLITVSVVHTLFALVLFQQDLVALVRRGLFNTVGTDARLAAVVWFLLFGAALFIAGLAVSALERAAQGLLPKSLGWSLLALALLGVVLMPASGFWLAFPPAIAVLGRKATARLTGD